MDPVSAIDILLVEDHPQDVELTLKGLQKRSFADLLFVVGDGAEASDFIFCRGNYAQLGKIHSPKPILLDLKLPKMNGLEVLRAIKEDKRTSAIPAVMVNSSGEDPDINAAYQLGANSYVEKPVDFDAFVEAICSPGLYWLLLSQSPVSH
jgi:two-component system, response regulator